MDGPYSDAYGDSDNDSFAVHCEILVLKTAPYLLCKSFCLVLLQIRCNEYKLVPTMSVCFAAPLDKLRQ